MTAAPAPATPADGLVSARSNILLVDDRPENLLALEAVLEPLGQNLVRAHSGEEALRHLLADDFAVILLDVQMPGIDGFETAEYIKRLERTSHIPIIFLTAISKEERHVFRGYETGAVDYLFKPFDPTILRSKVAVFVELHEKTNALERARLQQRHSRQLQGLAEASVAIAGAHSVESTLGLVTARAREIIGAGRCVTSMVGDGNGFPGCEAVSGFAASAAGSIKAPLTGVDGQPSGTITVFGKDDGDFSDGDRAIVAQLAQVASATVERVRLYEQAHGIAETLQRSLLPERLPGIAGAVVAARYEVGGDGVEVGGDWYDVIPLDDGTVGLVIGDVVGRGLTAATVMGQLRTATRAYALDGHSPAEVARRMNTLVQTLDLGHMTTLVYLIFEPGTGRVRFTCAGHPAPVVRRADGSAEFLAAGRSLPLGVVPSASWDEGDTCLEPGSTLVLYTDGLVEERGVPIGEGLDDLRRALCSAPEEPEALCDHLLDSRLHGRRDDDVAVLALRALPRGNELLLRSPLDPARLSSLRAIMREWLTEAEATSAETYEITTAFGEAITNAMEHPLGREQAAFEARVSLDGREVAIAVRDFGRWRPPRPSDRGRGLNLMEALMHSVEIESGPKGTEVRMRRKLERLGER